MKVFVAATYLVYLYVTPNFVVHRFLAEKTIQRGDDFMGRLFYPLRSIPNSGEEKTFVLHSHSGRTQHGFVTLHLSIGAKRKKMPLPVDKVKVNVMLFLQILTTQFLMYM